MIGRRVEIPTKEGHAVPLDVYIPEVTPEINESIRRPAVIICPGGAYRFLSHRESEPVALDYASKGFNTFVVWYRVAPHTFPEPQRDAAAAVAYVRAHAEEWNTDPDQIALLGFSAGAHCACSVAAMWQEEPLWEEAGLTPAQMRPNALILGYPVVTGGEYAHRESMEHLSGSLNPEDHMAYSLEYKVTDKMPPTFLWHTWEDEMVPVENTLLLAVALRKHGILTEIHVYPHGRHGSSLCRPETSGVVKPYLNLPDSVEWVRLSQRFLRSLWNID